MLLFMTIIQPSIIVILLELNCWYRIQIFRAYFSPIFFAKYSIIDKVMSHRRLGPILIQFFNIITTKIQSHLCGFQYHCRIIIIKILFVQEFLTQIAGENRTFERRSEKSRFYNGENIIALHLKMKCSRNCLQQYCIECK